MPNEIMRFSTTGLPDSMMLPSEKREFSIAIAFALWLLAERKRHRLYGDVVLSSQRADQQWRDAEPPETAVIVSRQASG